MGSQITSKAVAACESVSSVIPFHVIPDLRGIGLAHLLHLGPEDSTFESFKIPDMKPLGPRVEEENTCFFFDVFLEAEVLKPVFMHQVT